MWLACIDANFTPPSATAPMTTYTIEPSTHSTTPFATPFTPTSSTTAVVNVVVGIVVAVVLLFIFILILAIVICMKRCCILQKETAPDVYLVQLTR